MPAVVTLDDLTAMMAADKYGNRYEANSGGGVFITPLPDSEHAVIVSQVIAWFVAAGWPPVQVLHAVGIRIPDLTLWSKRQPRGVWRDAAQTVTLHRLAPSGEYEVATKLPLAWLLTTEPADHLD